MGRHLQDSTTAPKLFHRWYHTCSRVENKQFLIHIVCRVEQGAVDETGTPDGTFKIRHFNLKVRNQLREAFD
jgi:hypothetical protein